MVMVFLIFSYIFVNKKDIHYSTVQTSTYKSSFINSRHSLNHHGYNSQCTAICWDGTCSKSLGRRGVCSRHGGVKHWLR